MSTLKEVTADERDLFEFERAWWSKGRMVVGLDEVGRGALAGPLMVGAVALSFERPHPKGLDDSKRLSPRRREALVPEIRMWCECAAVGSASAREIDDFGLSRALGIAGRRALSTLALHDPLVLLDGSFDFLNGAVTDEHERGATTRGEMIEVTTIVRGDARSALIAAASVLAKVERDALMRTLATDFAGYGWAENKGYGSSRHLEALRDIGPSVEHRISWRLPMKTSR